MGPVSEFTNLVEEQHGGQQRGRTSAIGIDIQTPSVPRCGGKTRSSGMRNSICRVRERKIALCGLPIILEKIGSHDLESDVGKRTTRSAALGRRRDHPLGRSSVRSIDEEHRHLPGKELSQQESRVVTQTAHTTVCRRTFNTRSYRRRRNCTPRWAACLDSVQKRSSGRASPPDK